MFGKGNGKVKVTKLDLPIEDVAVVAGDMAVFAMACIIGGASSDVAIMTANNLLVREIQKFAAWRASKKILDPRAAEDYLQEMHMGIFEEFKLLAALNVRPVDKTEESKHGDGSGDQGTSEQATGSGNGDPKIGIAEG